MISFLALKSFRNRKFISSLCILSIALSISLFLIVEKLRIGIENGFTNSISNADLIVGARSGPTQLLLYSIFHMGSATNNMTIESYNMIKDLPAVDWTIPLSLGDSYKGHRVVATNKNFFKHYQFRSDQKLAMQEGQWFDNIFGVVLGSKVAKSLGHKIHDSIVLSHGISQQTIIKHDDTPFKVVGILESTGTPVDKSLYISLYGMEALHIGWDRGVPDGGQFPTQKLTKEDLKTEQITSFILRTKNRIALLGLQRFITNYQKEALSAIIPAVTLNELWKLLDQLESAFLGMSLFIIIIGFLTILIALYMSLNERKKEIAILRSVGGSVWQISSLLITEAAFLSVGGAILGLILHYLLLAIVAPLLTSHFDLYIKLSPPSQRELIIVGIFIIMGTLFGLIPAFKAYKTSMTDGLR